jgi:hypothetical protein
MKIILFTTVQISLPEMRKALAEQVLDGILILNGKGI